MTNSIAKNHLEKTIEKIGEMREMSKVEKKYEHRLEKLMKQGMYYLSLTKQDRVRKRKRKKGRQTR